MTPRHITQAVLLTALLLLGGYDLFAYFLWGRENTISVVLYETAQQFPILAFGLGLLSGHLFWPIKD